MWSVQWHDEASYWPVCVCSHYCHTCWNASIFVADLSSCYTLVCHYVAESEHFWFCWLPCFWHVCICTCIPSIHRCIFSCLGVWTCCRLGVRFHVCPSKRQTRPPKVEWWCELQIRASSGLIGLLFSQGMQAELLCLSLSNTPTHVMFSPFSRPPPSLLCKQKIDLRKDLKKKKKKNPSHWQQSGASSPATAGVKLFIPSAVWQRDVCVARSHLSHTHINTDECSFLTYNANTVAHIFSPNSSHTKLNPYKTKLCTVSHCVNQVQVSPPVRSGLKEKIRCCEYDYFLKVGHLCRRNVQLFFFKLVPYD